MSVVLFLRTPLLDQHHSVNMDFVSFVGLLSPLRQAIANLSPKNRKPEFVPRPIERSVSTPDMKVPHLIQYKENVQALSLSRIDKLMEEGARPSFVLAKRRHPSMRADSTTSTECESAASTPTPHRSLRMKPSWATTASSLRKREKEAQRKRSSVTLWSAGFQKALKAVRKKRFFFCL